MTANQYKKIHTYIITKPKLKHFVVSANRFLPLSIVFAYLTLFIWKGSALAFNILTKRPHETSSIEFSFVFLVPAVTTILGSFLRKRLNIKRPYEQENFIPLVERKQKGKSFPSRHVLCAAVIATTWHVFSPIVAFFLAIITLCIAILRVLTGIHSTKDVIAGIVFGASMGFYGAYLFFS